MRKGKFLLKILLADILVALLVPANFSFAVGEPVNGFPSWYERMIHVLTNRARCDPDAALVGCSPCGDVDIGCYSAVPPVQWHEGLNHGARFHATNLTDSGCFMSHNSPCNLVTTIGTDYPDICDGSVSCACLTGVVCGSSDPSLYSDTWERLALFGVSGGLRAENMAYYSLGVDPFTIMDLWLLETMTTEICGFYCTGTGNCNGHRYNILNGSYTRTGIGADGYYTVHDFWSSGSFDQKIPSGAHYPQSGGNNTEFRVNWYDSAGAPTESLVNIDGECFTMSVERGSGGNATYLYTTATNDCTWYYFMFRDSSGQTVFYPDTGAFGIGCVDDWNEDRPPPCNSNDIDEDGVVDQDDNCPNTPNQNQEDTFPSQRNNCGDACECEGNFDDDLDVDGSDASTFKADFGRSKISGNPCTNALPCNGDFECDTDVDGTNASLFKTDFGRSTIAGNPCPICPTDPWCVYP